MVEASGEARGGGRSGAAAQSLRELIERTFLLGVGAAALSKDRIQDVVEEYVRRGELSGEEGRDMVDRLMSRSREEARSAMKKADSSLQSAFREMGLVNKKDVEDIDFRLRQLEHRIQLLEAAADAPSTGKAGAPSS